MTFQTLLLLVIAFMIADHWYHDYVIPAAIVIAVYWLITYGPTWWREHQAERKKQNVLDADKPLREEFWRKHKAIRNKYDPKDEWNEGTFLPQEYVQEMADLNDEYRAVMDRWHNQ
jgi:hypothetical protein